MTEGKCSRVEFHLHERKFPAELRICQTRFCEPQFYACDREVIFRT